MVIVICCSVQSCSIIDTWRGTWVRETIPIKYASNKTITFKIHSLSGNTFNSVGFRCDSKHWHEITNNNTLEVKLIEPIKSGTKIIGVKLGAGGDHHVQGFNPIFTIYGPRHAQATIQIAFEKPPADFTSCEIIVCKTFSDWP